MQSAPTNDETQASRIALKAAGQPWQGMGVKLVGVGLVILAAAQIFSAGALVLLSAAVASIGAGWTMLLVAFVRRRRWVKAHPLSPEVQDPS
ncbi:MAG: hypothetical protein JO303_03960 [Caulobacteraceae bacterium]|nr:hypothetical protein [Caulobacteraceae bacterium]